MSTCQYCGYISDEDIDPVFGACHNSYECFDRRGYQLDDYGFRVGAAVAFGLMGMAEAIAGYQMDLWEAEIDKINKEMEERYEAAMRRDREAWRYSRDD